MVEAQKKFQYYWLRGHKILLHLTTEVSRTPQKHLLAYLMCAAMFKAAPVGLLFFRELNPWAIIAVIGLQYLKRRLSNLPHRWAVARENCGVLRWRNLDARESVDIENIKA